MELEGADEPEGGQGLLLLPGSDPSQGPDTISTVGATGGGELPAGWGLPHADAPACVPDQLHTVVQWVWTVPWSSVRTWVHPVRQGRCTAGAKAL